MDILPGRCHPFPVQSHVLPDHQLVQCMPAELPSSQLGECHSVHPIIVRIGERDGCAWTSRSRSDVLIRQLAGFCLF